MSFGSRLNAIGKWIPNGRRIVDVGTDHAYLPVLLVQEGKITGAIAVDIAEGPCAAAQRTVDLYGLGNIIEVRCGDGLSVVDPGEADVAAIAGMGGVTMIDILEKSKDVVESLERLVLQPMNGAELLRSWLLQHNWHLHAEDLIPEGDKLYEVIVAEKGQGEKQLDDVYYEVGPLLLAAHHPLLAQHIKRLMDRYASLLIAMDNSDDAKHSEKYQEFLRRKNILEELYYENYSS